MAEREHRYETALRWTGNRCAGTARYRDYGRDHVIAGAGKPDIAGSADPAFLGDAACWNPEELLVAALSACHQLSYLAVAARAGLCVVAYEDRADGVMVEAGASGRFTRVTLRPALTIAAGADAALALALHEAAHAQCYLASSMAFPVLCEPVIRLEPIGSDPVVSGSAGE